MAQEEVFWEDFWIEVELHPYGRLKLLGLMLQDYDWLADEQIRNLPSRALVIQLLQTHVVDPGFSEQEIASWSDDHIQHIAVAWWNEQAQDLALEPLPEASSFDLIKAGLLHLYEQKIAPQQTRLRDFLSSQQRLLSGLTGVTISLPPFNPIFPVLDSGLTSRLAGIRLPAQELQQFADMSSRLQGFYQRIMKSTSILNIQAFSLASQLEQIKLPLLDPSAFFGALPDLSQLKRFFEQAQQEHAIFDESGYNFIGHLISARVVSHFALYPERVRAANIANVFRGVTCDPRFESLLAERFEPLLVLRRRWKLVKQALHAHRRREYALSIPVFLAQFEGIMGDVLLLEEKICVVRKGQVVNGKTMKKMFLCRKGPDGKPALYTTGNKQGQPREIYGMHDLITASKWTNHPELEETAKLMTDQIEGDRNGIAHGRRLDYGTAKLSIQALLLLRVLAEYVHAIETGQVETAV